MRLITDVPGPSKRKTESQVDVDSPDVPIHLYSQPGHLFRRSQQIAVSLFYKVLGDEITPIQYAILLMVRDHPGVDQKTLAGLVALDSSTTWQTAMRLESKALLRRDLHISGRRHRHLYLTETGERVVLRVAAGIEQIQEEMFKGFKLAEREQFLTMLQRFVDINNDRSRAPLEFRGTVSAPPRKRAAASAPRRPRPKGDS